MADAHSDSAEDLFPTLPGYPPHVVMLRILGEEASRLSDRAGRKFVFHFDVDGGVGTLRAVRDDGYHAAVAMRPAPDAPRYARADGERIGVEDATPEERARLWFLYQVHVAVEAFVNGHNQVAALQADKERLDFLDACNAALNSHYGTNYGWELILSHNITRLLLGDFWAGEPRGLDLNDSAGGRSKLPSCRAAIDAKRPARKRTADARLPAVGSFHG